MTPLVTAHPVATAAGDIACDPESADFNDGLGTATKCRAKYLVRMAAEAAGCDFPPGLGSPKGGSPLAVNENLGILLYTRIRNPPYF